MPIYEYRCGKCGSFEQIQKMSDPHLTVCPTCGGPIEKELSSSSFQLKGGGWYKDGYSSAKPAAKSEKSEKSETPPAKKEPVTKKTE